MTCRPIRVQLRRTKGWRIPADTKSVARPTIWGNPYPVVLHQMVPTGDLGDDGKPIMQGPWLCQSHADPVSGWWYPSRAEAAQKAVDLYRLRLTQSTDPAWTALRARLLDDLRWQP